MNASEASLNTDTQWQRYLRITAGDAVLCVVGVVLILAWYWPGANSSKQATMAEISVGSKRTIVSLYQSRILTLHGASGDSTLKIENGRIRFLTSSCPNKICVHSGWHHKVGGFACAPNGIVVELKSPAVQYDAINY